MGGGHLGFDGTWIEAARQYDVLGRVVTVQRPGFGTPQGAATTYALGDRDDLLELSLVREPAARDGAVNVYQALFDHGLAELVPGPLVRDIRARTQEPLPHTVEVRARADGRGFLIVTPGVRLRGATWEDQKRVMTPEAAIRAGADYFVVGQPIRDAADPVAAAREMVAAMAALPAWYCIQLRLL